MTAAAADMSVSGGWTMRLARESDIPALEQLIPLSARGLQTNVYTPAQIEAALGPVFGVDRQLIRDGTFFVVEHESGIIACGGWSRRKSLYGSDHSRTGADPELDPKIEPARMRAFFVHPAWSRRGLGRALLVACETAIFKCGFNCIELVATLAGEPLYAAFGYEVIERFEIPMREGLSLPVCRMARNLSPAPRAMA